MSKEVQRPAGGYISDLSGLHHDLSTLTQALDVWCPLGLRQLRGAVLDRPSARKENLHFLGSCGISQVQGLNVAFLSGSPLGE